MQRRLFLSLALSCALRADASEEAWDALTEMASALGRGNATAFAAALDSGMAGYQALRDDVTALLGQQEVQCSLDLLENSGDDAERTIAVDWLMVLTPRAGMTRSTRRRQTVRCQFRRRKKWFMTGIEPRDLFKPPVE
jgi:hypothetical protein